MKLIGQSSGMAYGELGPTHHSIAELAWLRSLPNLTIIVLSDRCKTAQPIRWAAAPDGPVLVRVSRMPVPDIDLPDRAFRAAQAELLRRGDDLANIVCGKTVRLAVAAADLLAGQGIGARVLNMATIARPDEAAVPAAAETGAILTFEQASVRGWLGGPVADLTCAHNSAPVERVGAPGFLPTGSAAWLFDRFGPTAPGIAAAARPALQRAR